MPKPEYRGPAMRDEAAVDNARAAGLPEIDGQQCVGRARRHKLGEPAINWYKLEDGTEVVRDDAGRDVAWPD